jgi:hypothetical protein
MSGQFLLQRQTALQQIYKVDCKNLAKFRKPQVTYKTGLKKYCRFSKPSP